MTAEDEGRCIRALCRVQCEVRSVPQLRDVEAYPRRLVTVGTTSRKMSVESMHAELIGQSRRPRKRGGEQIRPVLSAPPRTLELPCFRSISRPPWRISADSANQSKLVNYIPIYKIPYSTGSGERSHRSRKRAAATGSGSFVGRRMRASYRSDSRKCDERGRPVAGRPARV